MAGLVNDTLTPPQQEQDLISPEKVQASLALPPNLQEPYQRVVLAGMKVMFSKETHSTMIEELNKPGAMGKKLGEGIAGLMLLLFQQSRKTMPPQLLIPAGTYLLAQAADFAKKSGQPVTNADVAQGTTIMINTILPKFGVDPNKLAANVTSKLPTTPAPQPAQGA